MALHDIREVRIPIELDKPRTLLFDLNAFAELEDIWNEYGVFGKADDE